MGRFVLAGFVSCLALCLAAPVVGAEDDKGEIAKLRQEVSELKAAMLEQDINAYLAETNAWEGAQGGDGLKGVTLHADFVVVMQGTLGQSDPASDIAIADGFFDLNFDLQVNDRVSLFLYLTANNGGFGSFPIQYFATSISGAPTLAGFNDGIGVNGTAPTNPGAVTTNEAGVRVATHLGDTVLNWEMGEIDPRKRFMQNSFVPNNHETFLHNSFTDLASFNWLTNLGGTTSLGWYMWLDLGDQKQFKLSWGWFNTPGEWFKNGQLYVELAWKGEVSGREMNVKVTFSWDEFNPGIDDDTIVIGGVWDWWLTEKIGVFFMGGFNTEDTANVVDYDFSFGFIFMGMVESRPDDQFGAGFVFTHVNSNVLTVTEDTEFGFEVYYRFALGDGKVFVTPHFMFIIDPGGGQAPGGFFVDDSLFIVGIRMHVPF